MKTDRVWYYFNGKPQRLYRDCFRDETGRLDEEYRLPDGTSLSFIPSPLEIFQTKNQLTDWVKWRVGLFQDNRFKKATKKSK